MRLLTAALLLTLAVALAAGVFVLRVSEAMPDFDVYWRAGVRAAAAEPLYRSEDGHYQLKYLPAFAVLAVPLGALPRPAAAALWFSASVAMLGLLLATSIRLLPQRRKSIPLLVAAAVLVLGKFYARELLLGQVNLLFALAIVVAVLLLARGRDAAGGLLVALAVAVKPYAVLLLPWLATRRRWPSVLAAGGGLALIALLPAVFYGAAGTIALHREWLDAVLTSTAPNLPNPDNVSWLAMYTRWFGPGAVAGAFALATAGAVLGLAVWVCAMRGGIARPEGLEGALLLAAIPFLSPQGWDYVLVLATPAVVFLVNYEDRLPGPWRALTVAALLIVGLTVYDVMGRTLYQVFMQASGVTLSFFVVIGAVVVLRRKGV